MKSEINTLTVGPSTGALLLSLRAIEQARNYYYSAFEAMGGESSAAAALSESAPRWDAVRELVERAITDGLRTWAGLTAQENEI